MGGYEPPMPPPSFGADGDMSSANLVPLGVRQVNIMLHPHDGVGGTEGAEEGRAGDWEGGGIGREGWSLAGCCGRERQGDSGQDDERQAMFHEHTLCTCQR